MDTIELNWDFTCGSNVFGDGKPANDPSWSPYIVVVKDRIPKIEKRYKQHPEILKSGALYAEHGSLWVGELKFKINDNVYSGKDLNIVQMFGGTGYGVIVIDKNNPIK